MERMENRWFLARNAQSADRNNFQFMQTSPNVDTKH